MAMHEIIPNATGWDELLAGPEVPVLTKNIAVRSGTSYQRGMLIAVETDGGTTKGRQAKAGDTAEYVLMRDVDATKEDAVGTVYVKGRFNRVKIVLAKGDTVEAHEAELRLRDIHFTALKS